MSDAILTTLVAPIALLLLAFIVNEVGKPLVRRWLGVDKDDAEDPPSPVVGVPVVDPTEGWRTAHAAVVAQLADEAQDHQRTIRAHEACHDQMRAAGLTPPEHD